jgi:hypothetical protein
LLYAQDLVVGLDYGQSYLYTYHEPDADFEDDPAINVMVDRAIDAGGIAQARGVLEAWDGPPPDDAAEWPEAFEAHLDVEDYGGLAYDSPAEHFAQLDVLPSAYHALITGRGFVAHGWPGSTTPGDSWRIRLWPSAGPQAPGACAPGTPRPLTRS